jgi:predicted acetyltransferase
MTRERLYRSYIEELKFFNPMLQTKSVEDAIADYNAVSQFEDLTWIDLYDGIENVGFILVVTGEHCTADADYMIMETYVHPEHRGKGIAFAGVENLFKNNPGNCGLFILNTNIEAHKFWNLIIDSHKDSILTLPTSNQYDNAFCKYYLWAIKPNFKISNKKRAAS